MNATATDAANAMLGNSAANRLRALGGNDKLEGGAGNDTLDGGAGYDTMVGGTGNDIFYVSSSKDVAVEKAGQGTDRIITSVSLDLRWNNGAFANVENITLATGAVNATATDAANAMLGNSAANRLRALGGNDKLDGGAGNDTLIGSTGADTLVGGTGIDHLYGGGYDGARDVFVFRSTKESPAGRGRDVIFDFAAKQDIVDLRLVDANTVMKGDQAFVFAKSPTAFGVWASTNSAGVSLLADVNGDRAADLEILLSGATSFSADSLFL